MKKKCTCCKKTKDTSEFSPRPNNRINSWCKVCNAERSLVWHRANPEKSAADHHDYEKNNREHLNEYKRNYQKLPQNRIKHNFYCSLRKTILGIRTGEKFCKQTGLKTPNELLSHLVSTIPEGYSLSDYGSKLHVDHIMPCSSFDLTDEKCRAKCFHYTNLRLIPKEENQKKAYKIIT